MTKRGQSLLDSIRGGMPMVNNILTTLSFLFMLFDLFLQSAIPLRLLGVKITELEGTTLGSAFFILEPFRR